jgi:hypothetical protein
MLTVGMHGLTTLRVEDLTTQHLLVHLDANNFFGCLLSTSEWHPEDWERNGEGFKNYLCLMQHVGDISLTGNVIYMTSDNLPSTRSTSIVKKAPRKPTLETPSSCMTPETIPASPSTTHDDNQPPSFPDHENPDSLPRCNCQMGTSHTQSYCCIPNRNLMPDSNQITSTLCKESIISDFGSSQRVKTIPIIQTHHPFNFPMQSVEKSSTGTQNMRLTTRNKVLKMEATDLEVRKLEVPGRDG